METATTAAFKPTATVQAPWKSLFLSHMSRTQGPAFFVLSTVSRDSDGKPIPRGRVCGFRGFFGELKLYPAIEGLLTELNELNPPLYESDMLTFTTDMRMAKIEELAQSQGAVEAVFWTEAAASQWRVNGTAFVIGDPTHGDREQVARHEIQKGLRERREGLKDESNDWSWENEVTAYFANHTPVLRGSFRNPPPGIPIEGAPENSYLKLGQKVFDFHDPVARENFRVVVIRPEEVQLLDVTDYEKGQRWKWTLVAKDDDCDGEGKAWHEAQVWP